MSCHLVTFQSHMTLFYLRYSRSGVGFEFWYKVKAPYNQPLSLTSMVNTLEDNGFGSSHVVLSTDLRGCLKRKPLVAPLLSPSAQLHSLPWEIVEIILDYACIDDISTSAKLCRVSAQIYHFIIPRLLSVVIWADPRVERHTDQFLRMLSSPIPRTTGPPRGYTLQSLCLVLPYSYTVSGGQAKIAASLNVFPNLRNVALGIPYFPAFLSPSPPLSDTYRGHLDVTLFPDPIFCYKVSLYLSHWTRSRDQITRRGVIKAIHALHFVSKCDDLAYSAKEATIIFTNLTHLALTYDDGVILEEKLQEDIPLQLQMLVVVVKPSFDGPPSTGEQVVHTLRQRDNRVFISWWSDQYEDKWVDFARGGKSIWDKACRETSEWEVTYAQRLN